MTKPKFAGKMVIILAGYDNDMNKLLRVNEGLSSRFADEVHFPSLSAAHCLKLLESKLQQSQIVFPSMQDPAIYQELFDMIAEMSKLPSWGNARDIETLVKSMVRTLYATNTTKVNQLTMSPGIAVDCVRSMLKERCARANVTVPPKPTNFGLAQPQNNSNSAPSVNTNTSATTKPASPAPKEDETAPANPPNDGRDPGVSDEVWLQLQKDKKQAELLEQLAQEQIRAHEEARRLAEEAAKEAEREAAELRDKMAKDEAERAEILRLLEEARIREEQAKAERDRIQRELEKRKKIEEDRKKKEETAQKKLREMGVCVQGYRWIKHGGGYRCAGGSHWISDRQLGI